MSRFSAMFILILVLVNIGNSQERPRRRLPPGTIVGRVVDSELGTPLEYANVVLYGKESKSQITGAMTDSNGIFRLFQVQAGEYTLEVSFMGYYSKEVEDIVVGDEQELVRAGIIQLERAVLMMEGVDVTTEKPAVEYKIDKRVINVSKDFTAISGTAVDVLENAPSVTVDVEGNVSLRGSTNFTLLIDGRPTVLEPNDALQQIPASNIEQIELITNPSAKYDPIGIAGIINIIMKKQKAQGTNGIANLSIGLDDKYGADFLLNHRTDKFNAFAGANYNDREYPGAIVLENQTTSNDTTSFIYSDGDSKWRRKFYGLRGGLDWYLSPDDIWSLALRYGGRNMEMSSERDYDEWKVPGDTHNLYISETSIKRGGDYYSLNMDYGHTFSEKEHKLSGHTMLSRRNGDEESNTELRDLNGNITSGQRSLEKGPSTRMQFNLDYSLPIWEVNRFESGYQASLRRTTDSSEMYEYNPVTGEYEYRSEFSNVVEYENNIHSVYALYKGEWGNLGYQAGLRGEYQYRFIELLGENEDFTIDQWDFFPSAHASYQFPNEHEMMASYTRRIDRPRGWQLEPFETWMDAYNVRTGNPALKPEYIDSYELGYQKHFGRNLLSLEGYYRVTHNKIERVRSVYDANIILHSVENVGTDYSYGAEAMVEWDLFKWLNLNLTGDIYQYRIEGMLYGDEFSRESFNWNARLNTTFRLSSSTRIQIHGIYYSPSVSSQGRREGFYTTNAAIRQDLWNRKLALTLQLRDILGTAKHEFASEGSDFYSYTEFSRKSPVVILALTFNFNRYRPQRREDRQEEFEEEEIF
ncbi:TonB-dependent receptor [candidate division WOR-3 bacterium]|nr:TonB-dependent receptor [candidate division WOR-3 bacterium]